MKNRVFGAYLLAILFFISKDAVSQPWAETAGVPNTIYTSPMNGIAKVVIKPNFFSPLQPVVTNELLQLLEVNPPEHGYRLYPILRIRDTAGNIGRLGINSNTVKSEETANGVKYPPLLNPFINSNPNSTIAGDFVLTTGRNRPPADLDPTDPVLAPNELPQTANVNQNLFIHSTAPMGHIVLSNESGSMPGLTTPRIMIKPKGEVLFQSNWDPLRMIGNPNDWTPKSDIQFGDRLFMYYWGNTMDFAFNRYWDNPQNGHLRAIAGGGGSLNFSTTGEFSVSTFCPGPAGSLVQWDGTKTLRMDCNGAVTVGIAHTPNPDFKLWVEGNTAVNGKIKAREVRVTVNSWPDYVFKKDYNLRPLSEVETFITTNGHLPGVIPARDAEANGVQVGEMQAKLLEKVEELTLYMIELKKENERLYKEVKAQSERLQSLEIQK